MCFMAGIFGHGMYYRTIRNLKKYTELLSDNRKTSVKIIVDEISRSIDFTRKDLQKKIELALFVNARIDLETDEVIIGACEDVKARKKRFRNV